MSAGRGVSSNFSVDPYAPKYCSETRKFDLGESPCLSRRRARSGAGQPEDGMIFGLRWSCAGLLPLG